MTLLPETPSFGQQLARNLGAGVGAGFKSSSDLIQNLMMEQQKRNVERQTLSDEAAQIKELTGKDVSKLSPSLRKEFVKTHLKSEGEKDQSKDILQSEFNRLSELSADLGFAIGPPGASFTKSEERAEYESSKAALLGALRDAVNKGVLTNQKFQFLLKQLPSHGDRQSVKIGKLRGIARDLGLDTSELDRLFSKEKKKDSKVEFDASIPEHKAKVDQLLKAGKSREEIEEILGREFTLT